MKSTLLVAALLLGSAACGSTPRSRPMVGALSLTPAEQHGQMLFAKYCHQCHPNGEAGLGPAINSNPAPLAAFRLQVRGGLGAMPSFPDTVLPERELDRLLAFVDAQRDQDE